MVFLEIPNVPKGMVFAEKVTYDVENLELNEMCTLLDGLKDRQETALQFDSKFKSICNRPSVLCRSLVR